MNSPYRLPRKRNARRTRIYLLVICAVAVPLFFALVRLSPKNKMPDAVTYEFSGGRFGDNLLAYLHGKWVSHKYKLPLLYKKFPYSDQLELDQREKKYDPESAKEFKKINFSKFSKTKKSKRSALYIVPYFPEFDYELTHDKDGEGNSFFSFEVDWKDEAFRKEVAALVKPKAELAEFPLPSDCLTVAVHVRRGGAFDSKDINLQIPLKAPPNQFYIDAIGKVIELFPQERLYAYIFTDDHEPAKIVDEFAQAFTGCAVTFDCREPSSKTDGILEDFFAMLKFDCLIRPESNYSYVASKLKDYKIVIHPASVRWENGIPKIERLSLER